MIVDKKIVRNKIIKRFSSVGILPHDDLNRKL